jgi:hypothetical protein
MGLGHTEVFEFIVTHLVSVRKWIKYPVDGITLGQDAVCVKAAVTLIRAIRTTTIRI